MKSGIAIAIIASMLCAPVSAAPALWYKWRSKLDGAQFCAQVSPGEGWERLPAPFTDGRCEKPAIVRG
jgi:hypothetical protein